MIPETKKGLIIITGIPGSGKTYCSKLIKQKLLKDNLLTKVFSTDNLQALLTQNQHLSFNQTQQLLKKQHWQSKLQIYELNKQCFNEVMWKRSRQFVQNYEILDILLSNCDILVIQDQLPLKSSRKPFRKYCYLQKIKYLEIQIKISLEKALQNNMQRGKLNQNLMVNQQVIKKSYCKFQHNEFSLQIQSQYIKQSIEQINIIQRLQHVIIQENYVQPEQKSKNVYICSENQLDQNEIRKLVNCIMKEQEVAKQYFGQFAGIENKQKAKILSECKKKYIQNKRKVSFKDILIQKLQNLKIQKEGLNFN